ncbi:MAG TPA: hypothetical protein VNW92_24535 [Polyangiaceae bacterium]|jgi:hypothetical protein|nr:hypothetical protein [Polyangiaceae bacterium]
MLRLTPEERLLRVEQFVESVRQIRELNEERPVVIPYLEATLDEIRKTG